MCLAVPAQITELLPAQRAIADAGGARREISVMLLEDGAVVGDWVLLHVGYALERIDEAEALRTLEDLRAMAMLDDAEGDAR